LIGGVEREKMADNSSSAIQAKDINAVNNWALRLYRQMIKDDEGNLLFCPISLLLNLQQARLITEGKCQEEVNKVIKIEEDSTALIIDQLGRLLEGGEASKANRPYDFFAGTKILLNNQHLALQANCLQDLKNLPAALTNKNSKDGAVIEYVERSEMKAIHSLINEVAKEVTLHRIDNITFKDPFSMDNDALLLLSIAHFHSHWEDKFLQRCSVNYEGRNRACVRALPATIEDFHNADGTIAKVLMLHLQVILFYFICTSIYSLSSYFSDRPSIIISSQQYREDIVYPRSYFD
jgi:serine protease inhibitor